MPLPSEMAGKIVGKAKAAGATLRGQHGIFRKLKDDHGQVAILMKRISSSKDIDTRRKLFPKVRAELLAHAAAEEQEFYPVLREYEQTSLLAHQARSDHQRVQRMLEELNSMDFGDPLWAETFEEMRQEVTEHVEQEEEEMFPRAESFVHRERADVMGERFARVKKEQLGRLK